MAIIVVVLFTLLIPLVTANRAFNPSISGDNYVVDLGYQLNQGHAVVNKTLVTFRNVRFAAPPIGSLRFLAPTRPAVDRTEIQNASDVICPQAYPKWLTTGAVTPFTPADIPPADPRTSEDCLFLDVLLPRRLWETRQRSRAPVLVWIHGGGFTLGGKDASGRGYGLVTRSQRFGSRGVIFISINYRLGLFGWMNGAGVKPNAGLLDQRFAFDWVQRYVHLFGGDPTQVTIIGESAGASSVEAHITAYGGSNGKSPFKGAIAQSPFIVPSYPSPRSQVDAVLTYANIDSLHTLRSISSVDLQKINTLLIGNSQPFGTFTFVIAPDDDYVPDLPGRLFRQERFDHRLFVMTGHNQDEASLFVPNPLITNESSYVAYVESLITPLANNATALNFITKELYPPIFDGSQGYTNQTERTNLTFADAFVCNARFMDGASFVPETYAYEFSVPPAVHGADVAYTFYDFGAVPGVNTTVAEIMQGYLTRFAETGQPNAPTLPFFSPARPGLTVQNLGSDFVGPMLDERGIKQLSERCRFWQEVPYLLDDRSDLRRLVRRGQ